MSGMSNMLQLSSEEDVQWFVQFLSVELVLLSILL